MTSLYPIKFNPILKDKIWGGNKLKKILNKTPGNLKNIGESWEISGLEGELSIVSNGFLKGNTIQEIIEIYMGDIVGDKVYETFGYQFPLLLKFIDANDYLSIQVHPDNNLAIKRHNSYGKTEMWYVIQADPDAKLIAGFNKPINKQQYINYLNNNNIRDILNYEDVKNGDVFFMPAGRIHATGPGILFAEIQQTSDITYRIYDWDRLGDNGKPRQLHTDLALDAIDYTYHKKLKTDYSPETDKSCNIISCEFFTTNIIDLAHKTEFDYVKLDSFVVYMAINGDTNIYYNQTDKPVILTKGETILIPAVLKQIILEPINSQSKLLEVYIS